jgi:hypothetical protein
MESNENYHLKVADLRQPLPMKNHEHPLAGSDIK